MKTLVTIIIALTLLLSCAKKVDECWICKTTSPDMPWFYNQETVDFTYCGLTLKEITNIEKEGTFITEVDVPVMYREGIATINTKHVTVLVHTITKCNLK